MAFYSLMNCDYCGGSSISFCQGDKCGQNHDLHKFLCDNCAKVHKFCRLCQSVIRTDAQTLNIERHREQIGFDSHVSILRKGLRECAHCGVKESDLNGLKKHAVRVSVHFTVITFAKRKIGIDIS